VPDHDFRLHSPDARLLEGRRALVTGATTGIGQGTAFELAAHGAAVAINHRGRVDDGRAMVAAIEAAGGRAVPVEMDVSSEQAQHVVGATIFVDGGMTLYPKFV
jgi:glucose 1-dehydrogenase